MQIIRPSFVCLICLLCFSPIVSASSYPQVLPISVEKVEPSSWRNGPPSDLVLHVSGQHLDKVAVVAVKHKGVRVVRIESVDANHLLVWVHISSDAVPGTIVLQVSTPYLTTFAVVPMFEQNANPSLASRGELTADK